MTFIKSNPFKTVDPTEFMVEEVARKAETQGKPLTESERELLRDEYHKDFGVPADVEGRLLEIVRTLVLEEEKNPPKDYRVHTFCNALEWAGDMSYPYVVYLTQKAYGKTAVETNWRWKAVLALGAVVALLVLIVVLLFMVVGRVFK